MLKATVRAIDGERVTLAFGDGQTLLVSLADIEGAPKVGSEIVLIPAVLGAEDAGRTKLAQGLLNELLKG